MIRMVAIMCFEKPVNIPPDQLLHIRILLMYTPDMLLEVVQPRPYLVLSFTLIRRTYIHILRSTKLMDGLVMSVEVVDGCEALIRAPTVGVGACAFKRPRVHFLMLPAWACQLIEL